MEMDEEDDDSQHIPSDIDSQVSKLIGTLSNRKFADTKYFIFKMSLPRSYTLPREFKFNRQGRKMAKSEHFVPSNNSSDGEFFAKFNRMLTHDLIFLKNSNSLR